MNDGSLTLRDYRLWQLITADDFVVVANPHYWQIPGGNDRLGLRLPRGTVLQFVRKEFFSVTLRLPPNITIDVPTTENLRLRRATPLEALAFGAT